MLGGAVAIAIMVVFGLGLFLLAMTVNPGFLIVLFVIAIFAGAILAVVLLVKCLEYCWTGGQEPR
jgi:hypothetical protein